MEGVADIRGDFALTVIRVTDKNAQDIIKSLVNKHIGDITKDKTTEELNNADSRLAERLEAGHREMDATDSRLYQKMVSADEEIDQKVSVIQQLVQSLQQRLMFQA